MVRLSKIHTRANPRRSRRSKRDWRDREPRQGRYVGHRQVDNRLRTTFCVRAFVERPLLCKRRVILPSSSRLGTGKYRLKTRRVAAGQTRHTVCDGKMKISASSGINPLGHLARCTIHFHFYAHRDERASERASERTDEQGEGNGDRGKTQIAVYRDEQEMNAEREGAKEVYVYV